MSTAFIRPPSRREFLKQSGQLAAAGTLAGIALPHVHAAGSDQVNVALIGCGGRGGGAASNAMNQSGPPRLVAMADVFEHRLKTSYDTLRRKHNDQVAEEFRLTRARIWSIRKKWREAGWVEPLPWQAGDWIEWAGVRFRVLRVDDERRGAVKTESGETVDPFTWTFRRHRSRLAMAGNNWLALN